MVTKVPSVITILVNGDCIGLVSVFITFSNDSF